MGAFFVVRGNVWAGVIGRVGGILMIRKGRRGPPPPPRGGGMGNGSLAVVCTFQTQRNPLIGWGGGFLLGGIGRRPTGGRGFGSGWGTVGCGRAGPGDRVVHGNFLFWQIGKPPGGERRPAYWGGRGRGAGDILICGTRGCPLRGNEGVLMLGGGSPGAFYFESSGPGGGPGRGGSGGRAGLGGGSTEDAFRQAILKPRGFNGPCIGITFHFFR